MIYYGQQTISQEDIDAVVDVLKSKLITQGPVAQLFESKMCDYTGASFSIACSHGTAALHLACLALGVGSGDSVWTVPNTFVASANAALYCGANVDFVDIDPATFNISIDHLKQKLVFAEKSHCLPKVLIPVHFAGAPCDMAELKALSNKYGFFIIEDASHALGARYRDCKIGRCEYSDITIFSFHPVKSITTGEGGMVLTNNIELANKVRLFANHGITRDKALLKNRDEDEFYYEQHELGFNYRITDIQSALGISQLARIDSFMKRRSEIADTYISELKLTEFHTQRHLANTQSANHLFPVCINYESKVSKSYLFNFLKEGGVTCGCHYIPVHLQPYYQKKGFYRGDYPNAESYYNRALSLPIYPSLSDSDITKIVTSLHKVIR